ncbi:MAG: hypothetical protein WBP93_16540 [Pyrinomonadaceae bacterium]
MSQTPSTSQPRLKPCLNCGEQIERDSASCWNCGAKRGALQLPKKRNATNEIDVSRTSSRFFLSEKIEKEATDGIISKLLKVVGAMIQILIAIPIILYLGFALLSILIFIFFIFPVVIPIAVKMSYLDSIRSTLRLLSRSPFYVSLISTTLSIGFLLLCGFLPGKWRMKERFKNAVEGDHIEAMGRYLFVPYPASMRINETSYHTYYKHRGILIFPDNTWRNLYDYYRSKITPLRLLTAFSAIVFISMVIKDYLVLKTASRYVPPLLNMACDLILLWGALIIGIHIGREVIKSKISCNWGNTISGFFSKANIVGDYLCSPVLRSDSYIMIYHLADLDELSFDEAEKVYQKFKDMRDNKIDLSGWSKIE